MSSKWRNLKHKIVTICLWWREWLAVC